MDSNKPVVVHRLDYQPSKWAIPETRLAFDLHPSQTLVTSELTMQYQGSDEEQVADLTLEGVNCQLISLQIDGQIVDEARYTLHQDSLEIRSVPVACVLRVQTEINPDDNTALEGLYRSSELFCTQCEAEGFRKITYYLDRPDVLSVYTVEITADQSTCPVLLSNGNLVSSEPLENGRHRVVWYDPYPKPSYLFALVGGNLAHIENDFVTASGREVQLKIYVQAHNIERCDFAMKSLIAAMRWDEQHYGFEYDLDCFMIVAVDDFNMGAMENKGLNIFNSRFVLADQQTATDTDYLGIESVIAHEYFHNWTGNRITCRDWFQLSLKEGLTVFRDQCFSSDQHSATVKRIEDVRLLRARQFPEDSGPMAHAIRPDSYIEINNFYTLTVYEKGAEVIRMLFTLLGPDLWRRGMNVYVERHDGTATTCEAFIDAMQSVTELDLTQFRRWYSTAGTPEIEVTDGYDASQSRYWISFKQTLPNTPGQSDKLPLHIPVVLGLLDQQGNDIGLSFGRTTHQGVVLDLTDSEQIFYFDNITSPPIASVFRGFSAPIKLTHEVSDETLAFLMANDSDEFNRWEAGQRLATRVILECYETESEASDLIQTLSRALGAVLHDSALQSAFKAELLTLPTIDTLAEVLDTVDFKRLGDAHATVMAALAKNHHDELEDLVVNGRRSDLALLDPLAMGLRRLANTALSMLSYLPDEQWVKMAGSQYHQADNMTDRLAALAVLCHSDSDARLACLEDFYHMANENRLVVDKWFAVQATAKRSSIIEDVTALTTHPAFDASNPNRLRALIGNFALNNPLGFHADNGLGYRLVANQVIQLDKTNPQVAARMVSPLGRWKRLVVRQQKLMRAELERIMSSGELSPDVYELVSKSLL